MKNLKHIVAVARNRVIGNNNQLCWHLPDDLLHFKMRTKGHAVIMGRKTWESLPAKVRPLPERRNIVITRQANYEAPGAEVAHSLQEALALVGDTQAYVIGGAELYAATLPFVTTIEMTEVDLEPEGDAWYPELGAEWYVAIRDRRETEEGLKYVFATYRRR